MSLIAAMILDAIFGEPEPVWRRLPHPAVLMGRLMGWLEARLNHGGLRRAKGALALAGMISVALAAGWLVVALPLQPLPEVIAAAILIAQKSLIDHVRAVADALDIGLPEGRREVAKIVGRDVEALDGPGVARAAIESGAENFSDGVAAPVFWFLIFGLPGMLVYKAINTADSMIGYRNERYEEFGWAAAKLDDLVNFIPARLSAALLALAAASHTASAQDAAKILEGADAFVEPTRVLYTLDGEADANEQSLPSYPSRAPRKELDFILFSDGIEVSNFEIPDIRLSDHLPLICDFEVTNKPVAAQESVSAAQESKYDG